ncbi:YHS domain-containing (seleno)protein [Aquimarina agarivorans]|uniref:YHS domain-containing (seleno)protein n=1 Tax=Aquimarina agarivorans TaxID=980584 RepID=UPI000248E71F|nr:YHS domain-containing (seleno)protein [Aquimarina agarivorans]
MKSILAILAICFSVVSTAQTKYLTKKGFVAEGYDVTEYFNGTAVEGNRMYNSTYEGVKFAFKTEANKKKFEAEPMKYIPQYGGYCAYALGVKDDLVTVDAETFEIRDGKLYLFYNSWGINTLHKWQKENPEELKKKADNNWGNRLNEK